MNIQKATAFEQVLSSEHKHFDLLFKTRTELPDIMPASDCDLMHRQAAAQVFQT